MYMKVSMANRELAEIGIDGWSSTSECERCYVCFTEATFQTLNFVKTFPNTNKYVSINYE